MTVNYTVTINGKDYGFFFENTRIDIDATIDSLDVQDLYTAIKEAQASEVGILYDTIADGEGLATLSTGIQTFLTVTLLSTWEVNTLKSSGKFEVKGGNLIRQDGADPFRDNPLVTYIAFLSQAGVLATPSDTDLTDITNDVTAIKNKTDNLPDDPAKESSVQTSIAVSV